MQNPQMPNMPGAGAMNDSLEFVKNLWGTMGVPGITAPTLSVDDLDKKIKDLKAVEIWLNVNTQMLRGTIQALEVQRSTLTALRSMGEAMANQAGSNPFAAFTQPAAQAGGAAQEAAPAGASSSKEEGAAAEGSHTPAGEATAAAMEMANPAMWWNMMQEQFQQALAQAAAAGGSAAAAPPETPEDKPAGGASKSKPHSRKRAE